MGSTWRKVILFWNLRRVLGGGGEDIIPLVNLAGGVVTQVKSGSYPQHDNSQAWRAQVVGVGAGEGGSSRRRKQE